MSRFTEIAQDATQLSDLYKERKKLDTSDLIDKSLTISDFDLVTLDDDTTFGVVLFEEYEGYFYNTGLVLTKMIREWADAFGGLVAARKAYQENPSDFVKIKLGSKKTKQDEKKTVTTVEIL